MTLDVIDFYTRKKLNTHPLFSVTMTETEFTMLVEHNGRMKEFVLVVPKKYAFKRTILKYEDFKALKLREYNVLSDFIVNNKSLAQVKWHLSDKEVEELVAGLEHCLIENYAVCGFMKRLVLTTMGKLDLILARNNFKWRQI